MYHHTKFGYKRFSSSEDMVLIEINEILNLCYDLDLGHNTSIHLYSLNNPASDVTSKQSLAAEGSGIQKI